jgi:hypothetical protein
VATAEAGTPESIFSPDDPVEALWIKAYQGEVLGEILFGRMAERYEAPEQSRKLRRLQELERLTREALVPSLTRAGVSTEPDPETVAGAEALADALAGISWAEFMGSFEAVTAQYIEVYARIGELDPSERSAADLLVAHEVALREFGRLEVAGNTATSLDAVNALPHLH